MQGSSSCVCRASRSKTLIGTVRWACGHTCAGRSVAVPTSYAQGWMLSSTEPVLYLGVVSDDIRSAMMYGPSPIEAMIVAVRLRDAIERYNREWHQRSALQDVRQDQDDELLDRRGGSRRKDGVRQSDHNLIDGAARHDQSEDDEHTSELQSLRHLVCR